MTDDQFAALISAIRAIAHGPTSGATGLELVAIALAGKGDGSVSASLDGIAGAIENLSHAVGQLASVMDHHESRKALRSQRR
jgi:hypothetical protein